ncbi:methyltransferase domain-containing protein [Candidatus Uhrbacteria bacterium]|nr:methyltransferase domain-containing protein [Candidatus Uhrbacteria bacterium]
MSITQKRMLNLLSGMTDGERKFEFFKYLFERNELTEHDLYELLVKSIERNPSYYFEQITKNDLLKYLWHRFQAYPETLARALVRVCPELFYGNHEWVTRLIIRLQSDKRLGTELGMITVAPKQGTGQGSNRLTVAINEKLIQSIPRDVRDLDVECRIRELLYWYSRDPKLGAEYTQEQIDSANPYEAQVWNLARTHLDHYLKESFPQTVSKMNDRLFPAMHVRWWLDRSAAQTRVLNIGDTGTYKTSYSVLAMRQAEAKKVLIFCAANARANWEQELKLYLPHLRAVGRVEIVQNSSHVIADNAEFIIVAYTTLVHRPVIQMLKEQKIDGIIWDESHYGKNVVGTTPAKRALGALEIIQSHVPSLKKVVANSATPWENSPEEIAALACILRPELFPNPREFLRSGAYASPRFLRALFETCILDIGLHEVRELPTIDPKPWEDLFNPVAIRMTPPQAVLYQQLLHQIPDQTDEEDSLKIINGVDGSQKVRYLLYACDMPHVLARVAEYDWPAEIEDAFEDWSFSAKLVWLKDQIDQNIGTAKIVVASGMYVSGITKPIKDDEEILWIGRQLREWYGEKTVLILDGDVRIGEDRNDLIKQWRTQESARILLVSMKTCPDSINLSVTIEDDPTLKELLVIGFALDWKPWKQFLGRFWREGLRIPMRYVCPVLQGTIDEARMELNRRKWKSLTRFRSRVPPTDEEWTNYSKSDSATLSDLMRSPKEWVSIVNNDVRGIGEEAARCYLDKENGLSTQGEQFARSFLAAQEHMASGHIARHMRYVLQQGLIPGGILTDSTRILDAGCGPATLARTLQMPVTGVDLNPWMITVAREANPELTLNCQVGTVSQLPPSWTGRFRLSVCSMVLDWTQLGTIQDSQRIKALMELIRVTDPHGLIWLTFNEKALDESLFKTWTQALKKSGCELSPLTGFVVPVEQAGKKKPDFAFWSIVFTAAGHHLTPFDPLSFRFRFELEQMKYKQAKTGYSSKSSKDLEPTCYERFVIKDPGAYETSDTVGVRQTLLTELTRWSKVEGKPINISQQVTDLFGADWRILQQLQKRGIISFT